MAANSNIEWTDRTWNPVAGCSIVSPGCHNCYAMKMAKRLAAMGQKKYVGTTKSKAGKTVWTGKINLSPDQLTDPIGWKKPQRIFVNSMSDLFHKEVPDDFIDRVFATMVLSPRHKFQILTKRAERMANYLSAANRREKLAEHFPFDPFHPATRAVGSNGFYTPVHWPLKNVWLGVSVEDQQRADERIPWLLKTPAAVRFLSCEPLLGPVFLQTVHSFTPEGDAMLKAMPKIDWVIIGGESGPNCRTCNVDWIRSIVKQCNTASLPVFVKQLGGFPVDIDDEDPRYMRKRPDVYRIQSVKDSKGGNPEEWPADLRVREFPAEVSA